MADLRALVIASGSLKRQLDADSLVVGAGVKTSSGDLTLTGASGLVASASNFQLAAGKFLSVIGGSAPAVSASGAGRIYFDSTANKYKVSENAGAYVNLIGAGGNGVFVQSSTVEVTANTTTTSTTFVDLDAVTKTLTTFGGDLIIIATTSPSNSAVNQIVFVQIVVDGVAKRGMSIQTKASGTAESGAVSTRVALSAGSHTVKLQWRTDAGTAQIRPVTTINEHTSMTIMEVTG